MTDACWQAVALSRDVRQRPLRVLLNGAPVVLFRSRTGLAALADRCPHRLVPLSGGKVVNDVLECPYHGWRFDAAGACVAIPGQLGDLPRAFVPRYQVTEAEGAIFLSEGQPLSLPYTHAMAGQNVLVRRVRSQTRSTLVDAAENILDATHTHFTHKWLLRGLSSHRDRVSVTVSGGDGWVEACYIGEDRQRGAISALLDGTRVKTVGRYRHPGIAELEYWGPKGIVLATTFHLRQADAETVEGVGWIVGPRLGFTSHLKALAFVPMFRIALAQDRRILRAAFDNARMTGQRTPMVGPLDFIRREIEAIAAGQRPPSAVAPRHYELEL
jgi:phenylpropionate dioxygenase-like ring-hydroxylating dioxygenase large terminal subunit